MRKAALILSLGLLGFGPTVWVQGGDSALDISNTQLAAPKPMIDLDGDNLPDGAVGRLGTMRLRHGNLWGAMTVSPDSKMIATVGLSKYALIWEAMSGKLLHKLMNDGEYVGLPVFSPDSKLAYTGNNGIHVWEAQSGKKLRTYNGKNWGGMDLSPDGKSLAVGVAELTGKLANGENQYRGHFEILDAATGKVTRKFGEFGPFRPRSFAFSADGKFLVVLDIPDGKMSKLKRWEIGSGKLLTEVALERAYTIQFSANRRIAVTSGYGVKVWDTVTGRQIPFRGLTNGIRGLVLAPDGLTMMIFVHGVTASAEGLSTTLVEPRVVIWDVMKDKEIREMRERVDAFGLAFTPAGNMILGATTDGELRRWDAVTGKEIPFSPQAVHSGAVSALAFSPDGKTLASAASDKTACIWEVPKGTPLCQTNAPQSEIIRGLAFMPDGNTLVAGGKLPTIGNNLQFQFWNTKTLKNSQPQRASACGAAFAISPDGKILAAIADAAGEREAYPRGPYQPPVWELRIWDFPSDRGPRHFGKAIGPAGPIAFSTDGKTLATGGSALKEKLPVGYSGTKYSPTLLLWHVASGTIVKELPFSDWIDALAFPSDGKTLVTGTRSGLVQVWDLTTGKERSRFHHQKPYPFNFRFAMSPDGKRVATADDSNEGIVVWDTATAKQLAFLEGHLGTTTCLAFSPDGKMLASGSTDSTVLLWDLAAFRPVQK